MLVVLAINKPKKELANPLTVKRMGAAYLNLRTNSKYQVGYNLLYLIRRTLYIIFMFSKTFSQYQIIQVLMLVYLNLFCLAYVIWHQPFSTKQRNLTEIFNEVTIAITTESMLFYTGIVDPFTQNWIGWASVTLFALNMVVNLLIV